MVSTSSDFACYSRAPYACGESSTSKGVIMWWSFVLIGCTRPVLPARKQFRTRMQTRQTWSSFYLPKWVVLALRLVREYDRRCYFSTGCGFGVVEGFICVKPTLQGMYGSYEKPSTLQDCQSTWHGQQLASLQT